MRCYLIVNLTKENAPSCARDAIASLCQAGAQVILTPETAVALGEQEPLRLPDKEAMEACDIAISIGGMVHYCMPPSTRLCLTSRLSVSIQAVWAI